MPNSSLFTIGHSNHTLEAFLKLLSDNTIEVLADVRSHPFSKYASQFSARILKTAVAERGIKYLYLGEELGGRPKTPEFYDEDGHVLYDLVAESPLFLQGIRRLQSGLEKFRVVIMCSEEDPKGCHRRRLIGRVLANLGIELYHIRGDGGIQTEEQLAHEDQKKQSEGVQLPLFAPPEEEHWRSVRSIRSASQSDELKTSSKP